MDNRKKPLAPALNKLYPDQTPDELTKIEGNLKRYLEIVRQIHNERQSSAIDRKQGAR